MRVSQYIAAALLSASVAACGGGSDTAETLTANVNGAPLAYQDNQAGAPVIVFLHGAVTDLRMWDNHRALIGKQFRTVAYTQRYHGTAAWSDSWPQYGVNTHSQDLTAFVEQLGAGKVHLVAWSYAGHIAFDAALRRPDLFRSVFVYEPGVTSYVTDPAAMEAWAADAGPSFGPIFGALGQGDVVGALKLLLESSGQQPGYFDKQSPQAQRVQLDNARTLTQLLGNQEPPPQITCAQLAGIQVPTRVGYGANTRPLYSVVSKAAQECIGGTGHLVVPGYNHMWPEENALAFTQAVLDFVKDY